MEKTRISKNGFNKIYKLLSVIAVNAVISAGAYLIFYRLFGPLSFLLGIVLAILCAAGYGMQALYGSATSHRRDPRRGYYDESGYEGSVTAFTPLRAAVPLTVAVAAALLLYRPYDMFLMSFEGVAEEFIYSGFSIYTLLLSVATFVGIASGVVLWFYPAHRVLSLRTMFSFLAVLLIMFFTSVVLSVPTGMMTFYLLIFTLCSFTVINQTHIQRGVSDTLTAISPGGRTYNLRLIAVAVVSALLLVFLASIVFTGLKYIGLLVFGVFLSTSYGTGNNSEYGDYTPDDLDSRLDDFFITNQPVGEKILFALFIILFITAIVLLIARGAEVTQRFFRGLKKWLRELFMFFMDIRGFRPSRYGAEIDFSNYQDEEIKLQRAAIRDFDGGGGTHHSYREFIAKLNALPTASEQIRFAYTTLMSAYRERGFGNVPSNTPREAKEKISARVSEPSLEDTVEAIETVNYAERELSEADCRKVITSMCVFLERQWED